MPVSDIPFRFLVHFVGKSLATDPSRPTSICYMLLTAMYFRFFTIGDLHQPLHLTGRERGGNGDPVLFDGRHMS
jgi:hypothetical protein